MLQDYEIKDGTILYDDQSSGMQVIANHLIIKGVEISLRNHFKLLTFTKNQ